MDIIVWIGALAAACTSLSYVPQVRKAWPRGSTADLSTKTLVALTIGLVLWAVYGALRNDPVIFGANLLGATLAGTVLVCKLRDLRAS